MITIVPVRFDTTPASAVWPAQLFHNWMQPLRPFSLANFWMQSSRGLVDLSYDFLDPVVMTDPRPAVTIRDNDHLRGALVEEAVKAATSQASPNWDGTDILLLWFAQPTDAFGGGDTAVPLRAGGTKQVRVTVLDIASTFDICGQELGHSFGFSHELDTLGNDYGSPYSVMSARGETGRYARAADANLPDGAVIQATSDENPAFYGTPAQRVVGPTLAGVQLHREQAFRDSTRHTYLGRLDQAVKLRLFALNYQERHETPPLVLATFHGRRGDGRLFALELRRSGFGYDAHIPAGEQGVVVHSFNPDGRIRYDGVLPLDSGHPNYLDWPCIDGDFNLRMLYAAPAGEFVDIEIRPRAERSFPIRGVLLAGGFRTQAELNSMSHDDMRNTLIVEMTNHSNQTDYQGYSNDDLAGVGAVMVFLRKFGIRDDDTLRKISADDQRNIAIVELGAQTGLGARLQAYGNLDLALIALGSDLPWHGQVPGGVSSWIRGVLLLGGFRSQHELNAMSHEDMRNTLIVELTNRTRQANYQAYNDAQLEGAGAVLVVLRHVKARTDDELRAMSADDMRNTLIVELDKQTRLGLKLQAMTDLELVLTALGVQKAVA